MYLITWITTHLPFDKTVPLLYRVRYTKSLNILGSFVFDNAADKQTDRQTDGLENPTDADRHSLRG